MSQREPKILPNPVEFLSNRDDGGRVFDMTPRAVDPKDSYAPERAEDSLSDSERKENLRDIPSLVPSSSESKNNPDPEDSSGSKELPTQSPISQPPNLAVNAPAAKVENPSQDSNK
ncbi:hypothetical protein SEA_CAMERICO_51 [Gordonia phage Camerico]|nr:hypothetical protein SEA_CAMERICO_51 [Gordonia phage Camerico]